MRKTAFYLIFVLTFFTLIVSSGAQNVSSPDAGTVAPGGNKRGVSFGVTSFIPKEPVIQQGRSFNIKLSGDNLDKISGAKVYFLKKKKGEKRPRVLVTKKIAATPGKFFPPAGSFKGVRVIQLRADKASADPNKNNWVKRAYKLMLFEKGVKRPYFLKDIKIKVIEPLKTRF